MNTATSHDRIFFVEVMGRDAGFLAQNSAIASGAGACSWLLVDVLAARTGGTEGVDAQVLHVQRKVHFLCLGHHGHRGGGGVDAALGFWRKALVKTSAFR